MLERSFRTGAQAAIAIAVAFIATIATAQPRAVPATQPSAPAAEPPPAAAPAEPGTGSEPVDAPTNLRLRKLEQKVQALKERAWRGKARVTMLKEAVLGGGVGAQASVSHVSKMGSNFRLIKLVYSLDGTQVFSRVDDEALTLYKSKIIDILTGPIAPGSHSVSVTAVYRGHGYGVFKYLSKYTFTVRSSHTFTVEEGKATRLEAIAYEKGGATTKMENRPALEFKVTQAASSEKE